ncbi:MAG: hypothetical protein AB9M60_20970, partial [Leptothrix sp. (in: b-proteobacteria)]
MALTACEASGKGTDYQVGPGKSYTTLDAVPWESLKAGDTVRIFYSATPYKGKFAVFGQGTSAAPIRICGVRGPNNERPIIEGNGATSRTNTTYAGMLSGSADIRAIHEGRTLVILKSDANNWTSYPQYIQIDGLNMRNAYYGNAYTNSAGQAAKYDDPFGACVWIDRGQNITIADNEISGCPMAIYSRSLDDGDFAVTKHIRIAGNYMWGAGYPGEVHEHTTYTESSDIVFEYNRYGALRAGAEGNSIKDRSVGTVVRYNRIEDGAHAIDLVEAEDFPSIATKDAAYRSTYVYGNLISKDGDLGSFIHYGGDHYGSTTGASWGEPIFRKGTLYFFNNTLYVTSSASSAWLFQLSTTEEKAEVWNNVFVFASNVTNKNMRMTSEISGAWTPGGIVNLGKNWISTGWADSDQYHAVPGQLNGTANLISGATSPLDLTTFVPLAGSAVVDAGVAGPAGASGYGVNYQISNIGLPTSRSVNGSAIDLGAIER